MAFHPFFFRSRHSGITLITSGYLLLSSCGPGDTGEGGEPGPDAPHATGGVPLTSDGGAPATTGGVNGDPSDGAGGLTASGGAASGGTGGNPGIGGMSATGGVLGAGGENVGTGGAGAGGLPPVVDCPETFENPLIWEDLPDLEVIRVGDVFYYTASTFHHSPGAPILRSYDLVHWEYTGHSVPLLDFDPSYDLNGGGAYVDGIWASTLQYRESNETFYWMGCMHGQGGGWVFTSKSPEGPWEKHPGDCYYDMGLLIDDDDTMYVAYGNNDISVATLSPDGFSRVQNQRVLTTTASVAGGSLEGSRFVKRGDFYYIFMTQYANGEWVTRSTSPTGPYETPRPFADRLPYAGAAGSGAQPHQGGIVETQKGDWYYIAFNDSYPGGRLPVMAPISWVDDWPVVELVNGQWGGSYPFPDVVCRGVPPRPTSDDFTSSTLAHEWEWNHNPENDRWSTGDGLFLETATVTNDLYLAKNTLTRRIEGPVSIATIELDYSNMQDGDVAGLAALRDVSAWIGVRKTNGATRVVMTSDLTMAAGTWNTTSTGSEIASEAVTGGSIWLRVEADIRTNAGGGTARFSYSTDGAEFTALGTTLNMNRNWQYFLGYRFGIFNYATQSLGGSVKITSFELEKP